MRLPLLPRAAACLWGAVVFMPVGLNYMAFLLLLAAMLVAGDWRERVQRLMAHPLRWPLAALVLWQLVVLAIGPHYAETGVNLWHGIRIPLTILLALMLTREEAVWAMRGFLGIAFFNIVYTAVFYFILLKFGVMPPMSVFKPMIMLVGNKSINDALLYTVLGAASAAWALQRLMEHRPYRAVAGFALTAVTVFIVNWNLPSRTSLLAMLIVLPLLCVHQWRSHWRGMVVALAAVVVVLGFALREAPPVVEQKLAQGVSEIEAARAGAVSEGSWVVRYHMYTVTGRMIADRPLAGWGIGAWNQIWRERGPALLANYNMPHNDFLWMGSQTGLPGVAALLAVMLCAVWQAWKRPDLSGRVAFAATLIMLLASCVNSALRDAQIGLSLLWVGMVFLRLSREAAGAWLEVLPRRWRGASV